MGDGRNAGHRPGEATDHPQKILSEALEVTPPIPEEVQKSFRKRMARALLVELNTVMQTLTASVRGSADDKDGEGGP